METKFLTRVDQSDFGELRTVFGALGSDRRESARVETHGPGTRATSLVSTLFTCVSAAHPFHAHVGRFRSLLARHPRLRKRHGEALPRGTEARAMLSGRRESGRWHFRHVALSIQSPSSPPLGFCADTFWYDAKQCELQYSAFPEDPRLPTAAAYFGRVSERAPGTRCRILRYVPRRRLTFRLDGGPAGQSLIGKIVRDGELGQARDNLLVVGEAVARHGVGFGVARVPMAAQEEGLFFQECLPGTPAADLITEANLEAWLAEIGGIHRELHELDVPARRRWDASEYDAGLADKLSWIGLVFPESQPLLAEVHELLVNRRPTLEHASAFCHGAFGCNQLLRKRDAWFIVDFDDAMHADPYLELGRFLARLKKVPLLAAEFGRTEGRGGELLRRAQVAHLRGYQSKLGEPLDEKRLRWYWLAEEISELAQAISRSRFDREILEHWCLRLNELGQGFARSG